jgi:hypothetical protein
MPYLVVLVAALLAGRLHANNGAWQLVSDRNGIQVYMQPGDQTPLKTFRGVTRFPLADEYAMVALLNDYYAYPDWLHFVDSARELGRSNEQVRQLHVTTLLPWPLADREAVLQTRVIQGDGPAGKEVVVDLSNRPDLLPPNPDYVRFPHMEGMLRFRRVAQEEVEVVYQLEMNPGGYIPAWLANILLRDAPYFTLERLRRVVHRAEYQGHYYDWLDLRGPGRPEPVKNVTKTP